MHYKIRIVKCDFCNKKSDERSDSWYREYKCPKGWSKITFFNQHTRDACVECSNRVRIALNTVQH